METKVYTRNIPVFCLLIICIIHVFSQADYKRYPFKADLVVQTCSFEWGAMPGLFIHIINQGTTTVDSIDLGLYLNATQQEMSISGTADDTVSGLGARLDIGFLYDLAGLQHGFSESESDSIRMMIMNAKAVRLIPLFDSVSGKHVWLHNVPLSKITLPAGGRLRLDLIWDRRSPNPPYEDLLTQTPSHIPGEGDWSWSRKLGAQGAPVDFNGIQQVERDVLDTGIYNLEVNPYITVFRKGQLIWGIPPDWKNYYDTIDTLPKQPTDPLPYALIANPFNEYESQLRRDSANLTISRIRVNQAGYRPGDENFFYYVDSAATMSDFKVVNTETGAIAGSGSLVSTGLTTTGQIRSTCYYKAQVITGGAVKYHMISDSTSGTVLKGILPDLPTGKYRIVVENESSASFVIHPNVYNMIKDALLKFYGISRCGDNDSWFHAACHTLDPVPGGWHDGADHLKLPQSTGYTMSVLGLCAAAFDSVDTDHYAKDQSKTTQTDGISDILAELKIGTDFLLASNAAGGDSVAGMKTEIGDFSADHVFWGPPEIQELYPASRGGAPRPAVFGLGGNTAGTFAAGLAFMGKMYNNYDSSYAAKCINVAKELYAFGKRNQDPAYNAPMSGGGLTYDELALAAMALWWATKDTTYKYDLLYNVETGSKGNADVYKKGGFKAGWFVHENPGPQKTFTNTCWDNVEVFALWGLYKLILKDPDIAVSYGISPDERLNLIEDIIYCLIVDIGDVSIGNQSIILPASDFGWKSNVLKCDLLWGWMHIENGILTPNKQQSGNITELFCYYDIASDVQGKSLPNSPSSTDWKVEEVKSVLIKQLGFMLGINPWDVSMIMGIGSKNFNHPHHRASNPELTMTSLFYDYRHPVGAFSGGFVPSVKLYDDLMGGIGGYHHSEVNIDGVTSIFLPVCGMSKKQDLITHYKTGNQLVRKQRPAVSVRRINSNGFRIQSSKPFTSVTIMNLAGQIIVRKQFNATSQQNMQFSTGNRSSGNGLYLVKINFPDGGFFVRKYNHLY